MILPRLTSPLLFVPTGEYVEAKVIGLTSEMVDLQIHGEWWHDASLKSILDPRPIDLDWDWNEFNIEYDGRTLASEKVAIVVGDEVSVEGAMMLSVDTVGSVLDNGQRALFVELLFTAPRNRPMLRTDGQEFLKGVGTELLTWAAWFSRENGCSGRLLLDGSLDYLNWYRKRGLQTLGLKPILYEAVEYTPMELGAVGAEKLLKNWGD